MRLLAVFAALLASSTVATAQSPIVGTWEGPIMTRMDGKMVGIPCHLIYTAEGYFSRLCVPDRAKVKDFKDLAGLAKDEIVTLLEHLTAQFGTYSVAGNKLTRTVSAAKIPNVEGQSVTLTWRIDNGDLIVAGDGGTESRYHRSKK